MKRIIEISIILIALISSSFTILKEDDFKNGSLNFELGANGYSYGIEKYMEIRYKTQTIEDKFIPFLDAQGNPTTLAGGATGRKEIFETLKDIEITVYDSTKTRQLRKLTIPEGMATTFLIKGGMHKGGQFTIKGNGISITCDIRYNNYTNKVVGTISADWPDNKREYYGKTIDKWQQFYL
jgi:hypothetical protein